MRAKKNKAKNSPNKKGYDKWQWGNLPHEIIQLLNIYLSMKVRRRKHPLYYMGDDIATTKSWVLPTTRCSRSGNRRCPELYLSGNSLNILSESTRSVALRTIIYDAAMRCSWIGGHNPTDKEAWNKCESRTIDPFGPQNKSIEFTRIIRLQSKVYALSLQGALAVIEESDSCYTITSISSHRAVPCVASRFFKEYCVIMNEEIFLVFLIHKKSLEIVDEVEVFRLCFGKLKWIKVERLQGKALIMDEKCYLVNSVEIGCRENCVYFTQGSDNSWWLYDMKSSCIIPV